MTKSKILTVFFTIILIAWGTVFSQSKATLSLPNVSGDPGAKVDVPITVSTDSSIGIAQFVVEFNAGVLSFSSATLGSDAPAGFSVSNVNPNLPFGTSESGTNDNVLVQVSGGGSKSFSGNSQEIVVLEFNIIGGPGDSSPLAFDEGSTHTYLSTVNLYDIDGNDLDFDNGSFNATVPVELSTFDVIMENDQVVLRWTTESESNNLGFEIQRKQNQPDEFKPIGFVTGHGTVANHHEYRYCDTGIIEGSYYYRLKQIDINGSYEFSEEKHIDIMAPADFVLEQNYPNPFNPETTIRYRVGHKTGMVTQIYLAIYNNWGQLVRTLVNEPQKPGYYSVKWDGTDDTGNQVCTGVYFSRLKANNQVVDIKITYIK